MVINEFTQWKRGAGWFGKTSEEPATEPHHWVSSAGNSEKCFTRSVCCPLPVSRFFIIRLNYTIITEHDGMLVNIVPNLSVV